MKHPSKAQEPILAPARAVLAERETWTGKTIRPAFYKHRNPSTAPAPSEPAKGDRKKGPRKNHNAKPASPKLDKLMRGLEKAAAKGDRERIHHFATAAYWQREDVHLEAVRQANWRRRSHEQFSKAEVRRQATEVHAPEPVVTYKKRKPSGRHRTIHAPGIRRKAKSALVKEMVQATWTGRPANSFTTGNKGKKAAIAGAAEMLRRPDAKFIIQIDFTDAYPTACGQGIVDAVHRATGIPKPILRDQMVPSEVRRKESTGRYRKEEGNKGTGVGHPWKRKNKKQRGRWPLTKSTARTRNGAKRGMTRHDHEKDTNTIHDAGPEAGASRHWCGRCYSPPHDGGGGAQQKALTSSRSERLARLALPQGFPTSSILLEIALAPVIAGQDVVSYGDNIFFVASSKKDAERKVEELRNALRALPTWCNRLDVTVEVRRADYGMVFLGAKLKKVKGHVIYGPTKEAFNAIRTASVRELVEARKEDRKVSRKKFERKLVGMVGALPRWNVSKVFGGISDEDDEDWRNLLLRAMRKRVRMAFGRRRVMPREMLDRFENYSDDLETFGIKA